jgi:hypothetical protein
METRAVAGCFPNACSTMFAEFFRGRRNSLRPKLKNQAINAPVQLEFFNTYET